MTLPDLQTVLLVEDNRDDVELAQIALAEAGLEVKLHVAHDGVAAIDYLRTQPTPALVLLDLNLPRVGGHEVLAFIRSTPGLSALPVVVLTTSIEPTDIHVARSFKADGYVQKPVAFSEFVKLMRDVASDWLATGSHLLRADHRAGCAMKR